MSPISLLAGFTGNVIYWHAANCHTRLQRRACPARVHKCKTVRFIAHWLARAWQLAAMPEWPHNLATSPARFAKNYMTRRKLYTKLQKWQAWLFVVRLDLRCSRITVNWNCLSQFLQMDFAVHVHPWKWNCQLAFRKLYALLRPDFEHRHVTITTSINACHETVFSSFSWKTKRWVTLTALADVTGVCFPRRMPRVLPHEGQCYHRAALHASSTHA